MNRAKSLLKSIYFKISIIVITVISLAGCTDRDIAKLSSYGGSANVKCYSGSRLIYEGNSTGKISSEENSDGYSFVDKKTGKLVEVSGNCIIRYNKY